MRFEPPRTGPEMASLQAAFKESIQKHFQLEPRELSADPMPSGLDRREILFYEASEGGAGVLRQIAEDPSVLPLLARRALEICHFDPDTLKDNGAATCGKACYQCLLDYGNQPDHKDLDRYAIRDFLAALSGSVCRPAGGAGSRAERMNALRRRCDSQLEKRWLDMLDRHLLRPPSDAQFLIETCSTKPDFYYAEHNAAIYIDGPPHDEPDQLRDDEVISQRLMEMGYVVIRFHHKADWEAIFRKHPDIFGVSSHGFQEEEELVALTVRFVKPEHAAFTEEDQEICRRESEAALQALLQRIDVPPGARLAVRFAGEGVSSYWIDYVIAGVGLIAGGPYVMHAIGEALEAGGGLTAQVAAKMDLTGAWCKSVAWRFTPKDPAGTDNRRPGCFGIKELLDRRYRRCRDCGFLGDCIILVQAASA